MSNPALLVIDITASSDSCSRGNNAALARCVPVGNWGRIVLTCGPTGQRLYAGTIHGMLSP
jgi:hypothetical protein